MEKDRFVPEDVTWDSRGISGPAALVGKVIHITWLNHGDIDGEDTEVEARAEVRSWRTVELSRHEGCLSLIAALTMIRLLRNPKAQRVKNGNSTHSITWTETNPTKRSAS